MTATVEGVEQVVEKVRRIRNRAPRDVLNAMKRCGTIMARAIKSNLRRKRTGLLAKSIGNKTKDKGGRVTSLAGPRKGFKVTLTGQNARGQLTGFRATKSGDKKITLKRATNVQKVIDPIRYAHLADKGHKMGRGKGAATGQHFMRSAANDAYPQCSAIMRETLATVAKGA